MSKEDIRRVIAIDVSKGYIDALVYDSNWEVQERWHLDDIPEGHRQFMEHITRIVEETEGKVVIACEWTGMYERRWLHIAYQVKQSHTERIHVYAIQPDRIHSFGKLYPHLNKTDEQSARLIGLYILSGMREGVQEYDPFNQKSRSLARYLEAIVKVMVTLLNVLHAKVYNLHPYLDKEIKGIATPMWVLRLLIQYPDPRKLARAHLKSLCKIPYLTKEKAKAIRDAARENVPSLVVDDDEVYLLRKLAREIVRLKRERKEVEKRLIARYEGDPRLELLCSIPGIGKLCAVLLLVYIVDIRRFSSVKKLVAFFGLDPRPAQSGDRRTHGHISKRGPANVRRVLFMCALKACQDSPIFMALYQRKRARHDNHFYAITPVMAKLLRVAYSVLKSGKPFDESYKPVPPFSSRDQQSHQPLLKMRVHSMDAPISPRERKRRKLAQTAPSHSPSHPSRLCSSSDPDPSACLLSPSTHDGSYPPSSHLINKKGG